MPKEIAFRTVSTSRTIRYDWARGSETKLVDDGSQLIVSGNLHRTQVKKVLNRWIAKQAKLYFVPTLKQKSDETGLVYGSLRFKNTKTRWGSCSERKTINLNIQMLFLPKQLSDQVLLHELCHLKHLNHSKDFWSLVKSFEPNYKILEKELRREARKFIPGWILRK